MEAHTGGLCGASQPPAIGQRIEATGSGIDDSGGVAAASGKRSDFNAVDAVQVIPDGPPSGVAKVLFSSDGGGRWQQARLGPDQGKYGFRQWEVSLRLPSPGPQKLMIKAINTAGSAQPDHPNWNGAGFMRNVIESLTVRAA
jgi:hypothetical protein